MLGADTNPNHNRLLYPEAPTRNHDLKIPKNPPIWEFCNWLNMLGHKKVQGIHPNNIRSTAAAYRITVGIILVF